MLHTVLLILVFFFVKQKTAYERRMSDWSSDVCSSDLRPRSAHPGRGASRTHRQADCSDCRTLAFKSLLTGRNAKDAGERNLANQRLSVDRVSVADVVCVRPHHADEPARPYAKARAKASRAGAGRATVWLWKVRHPSPSPLGNALNANFTGAGAKGAPQWGTAYMTAEPAEIGRA